MLGLSGFLVDGATNRNGGMVVEDQEWWRDGRPGPWGHERTESWNLGRLVQAKPLEVWDAVGEAGEDQEWWVKAGRLEKR